MCETQQWAHHEHMLSPSARDCWEDLPEQLMTNLPKIQVMREGTRMEEDEIEEDRAVEEGVNLDS